MKIIRIFIVGLALLVTPMFSFASRVFAFATIAADSTDLTLLGLILIVLLIFYFYFFKGDKKKKKK